MFCLSAASRMRGETSALLRSGFILGLLLGADLAAATTRAIAAPLFAAPFLSFDTGFSPQCVAIGDLNGAGNPDLAVANSDSTAVSVLFGNGGGSFALKTDFAAGTSPASVAIGDLNGDDKPDVVVANYTSNTVSVLLGNG